jgi:outer membrane protein assembly factor BamB
MTGDETFSVFALDAATGEELWRRDFATGRLLEIHQSNSHASSTPAADDERVYVYFSTLGMLALDAATGDDVWQRDLPVPYFVFKWGPGMSPVLHGDKVLFCQDDDLAPAFYAFDKRTGEIVWQDDRSDMAVNYTHPVICETETGPEIVLAGTRQLIGYDPDSGQRLWHANVLLRNIKTTPVCLEGVIYISLQSGGIANQWLASVDRYEKGNSDGKLTKDEVQAFVGEVPVPEAFYKKTFDRGDKNGDGVLEGEELDLAFLNADNFAGARFDAENPADEYILAVRGGGRGDVTQTHLLWKHPTKQTDHIVSPLVIDGRMLLVKAGGISTCYEIDKGEMLWGPKRINNAGEYFASPVSGDGKIYVAGENGHVVVLAAGPELEVLARNDLGESILATPAIADGRIFIRTRTKLVCVAGE